MKSTFGSYHPLINFGYFAMVIILGMFMLHPVFLTIAVAASFTYAVFLGGKNVLKFCLFFLLPMLIAVTFINPLINHQGETILGYFLGNEITFESMIYGLVTGFLFVSIILWCSCYNSIMTSDKFVYLFGRVMPAISLIFTMVLRFVPKFRQQVKTISKAQQCMGRDVSDGTVLRKAKHGLKILSVMMTWALENSIDTADSMRSRGYGLKGRTTFSIYRFDGRDAITAVVLILLAATVVAGWALGVCKVEYFPAIEFGVTGVRNIAVYAAYFLLCFLPLILDVKEALQWRHLHSKI